MSNDINPQYASFFFDRKHDIGTISFDGPDESTFSINRFDTSILFTVSFKNNDVKPYTSAIIKFRHGDDDVTVTISQSVDVLPEDIFTRTYIHIVEQNATHIKHTSHILGKNGWAIDGGIATEIIKREVVQ